MASATLRSPADPVEPSAPCQYTSAQPCGHEFGPSPADHSLSSIPYSLLATARSATTSPSAKRCPRAVTLVYAWDLRVRSYECDMLGHVNNAVYQQYLQEAAIAASAHVGYDTAWYSARGTAWVVRQMSLEYVRPARAGDDLRVSTWISTFSRVRSRREYEIHRLSPDAEPDTSFYGPAPTGSISTYRRADHWRYPARWLGRSRRAASEV